VELVWTSEFEGGCFQRYHQGKLGSYQPALPSSAQRRLSPGQDGRGICCRLKAVKATGKVMRGSKMFCSSNIQMLQLF